MAQRKEASSVAQQAAAHAIEMLRLYHGIPLDMETIGKRLSPPFDIHEGNLQTQRLRLLLTLQLWL